MGIAERSEEHTSPFLIARSSEEQLAMGEDLTRSRKVFEVQPRGLYSAYTIAMSDRLSDREESVR